ncbi:hypothetical protein AB0F72_01815 [Actinoplanes sp. NPDC023936]|uniref:hypothetical protein n=1 Tax=Actinoplanes sp. NPDC023936 TaxID=3154910 RepID=UPI00340FF20D
MASAAGAGLAVAVPTNGSAAQQRGKLERIGLSHIAQVFTPDDLGVAAGLRAVHLGRSGTGPAEESHRISTLGELATYL